MHLLAYFMLFGYNKSETKKKRIFHCQFWIEDLFTKSPLKYSSTKQFKEYIGVVNNLLYSNKCSASIGFQNFTQEVV